MQVLSTIATQLQPYLTLSFYMSAKKSKIILKTPVSARGPHLLEATLRIQLKGKGISI